MNKTKKAISLSLVALVLCLSMLLGTTYAWFTDSVTSSGNIIQSGNLDLQVFWTDDISDSNSWRDAGDTENPEPIFNYDKWEPGYTCVRYIKIVNKGNLAFKYLMNIIPDGEVSDLAEVIDVYYVNDYRFDPATGKVTSVGDMTHAGTLDYALANRIPQQSTLLPKSATNSGEVVVAIALKMQESAGNEYQNKSIGSTFSIQFLATQLANEEDSFGSDYDSEAKYPVFQGSVSATTTVEVEESTDANGNVTKTVKEDTSFASTSGEVSFDVGAGTEVDGSTLTGSVTTLEETSSNFVASDGEILVPVDIHVEGIAAGNTVPVIVTVESFFNPGLNQGNYTFGHVENGVTNLMTEVNSLAELDAHNEFYYDSATGSVTFALCSFSEVVAVRSLVSKWTGNVAGTIAGGSGTEEDPYLIANADQLAYFAKVIGYSDNATMRTKYIKLLSDIDLGYDFENGTGPIFTPIGYYFNNDYDGDGVPNENNADIYSTVKAFKGVFDGNGKTIKNFYQNTWEIDGDYNDGYAALSNHYKDGFGLFGYLNGATVKNLTIENFQSDGEFTPTGTIAAYACNSTIENITIINCNPRVYNTGNGGIIGIAGNNDDPDSYKVTLRNITVDQTNKITALWGSWDVACGGLIGMFRGDGHVYMENCHVAAQIDVHNDVCGNYQYYRYRYAGMMIGTNKNMVTVDGCTYPVTEKFHATNCSVYIGDWNDYYYCELVANSLASYTHDHQMSRLTHINSVSEIQDENGAWNRTGNFLIVTVKNGSKTIGECYHIVEKNGVLTRHMHEESGYDVGIDENKDGEDDLKEDKQRIYLPFNQLFTGYGWGVTHIPVTDANTAEGMTVFEGITVNSRGSKDSAEKFPTLAATEGTYVRHYPNGTTTITLNELFAKLSTRAEAEVKFDQLVVSISPEPDSLGHIKVTDTNIIKAGNDEWRNSTFTVQGVGTLYVTISDYYFCKPTTVVVVVDCATEVENPFNTLIPGDEGSKTYTRSTYESDMRIYPNGGTITVSKEEGPGDTVLGIQYGTTENDELVGATSNRYVDIYCNSQPGQSVAIEVDFKVGDDVELDYFYGLVLPRGFFAKTGSRVYHRNAGLTMENGKYYLSYTIRSESGAENPVKIMEIPAGAWVSLKAEYYFHGGNNELYYVITGSYTNENGEVVTATTPKVTLENVHGIKQNGFYMDMVRIGDVSGYIRDENNPCAMKGTIEFKNFKVYTTSKDINFDTLATDEPAYNVKTYENDGKTSVVNAYVTNPARNHTESWYVGNGVTFMTPSKIAHLDRIVETVDGVSNGFVALNYHTSNSTTAPYIAFNNYAQVGEAVKLSARFQLPANVYMTNNGGELFSNKTWSAAGDLAHVSLFNLVGDEEATKDLVAMSILNNVATVFDPYDNYVYASFDLGEHADEWFTVDVSYDMATGKKSVTLKGADGKTIVGERVDVEVGAFEEKVTDVGVGYISGAISGIKAEEYTTNAGNTYSIGSMRRTLYVDDYSFVAISTTVPGSGSVGDSEGDGDDGVVEDGEGDTDVTPVVDDQNNG